MWREAALAILLLACDGAVDRADGGDAGSGRDASSPAMCVADLVDPLFTAVGTGDYAADVPVSEADASPLYDDPLTSDAASFGDDTDYFTQWGCRDPGPGGLRRIRRLGIAPLGSHHPAFWKDSLFVSPDERSGGFPVIYFTQGLWGADARDASGAIVPGSVAEIYPSLFALRRAFYNLEQGRWLISEVLSEPTTTHGVSSQDGRARDFVFNQYQIGTHRSDWLWGFGPAANRSGTVSVIPGVSAARTGGSIDAYALVGTGMLGLSAIIQESPEIEPGFEVPGCVHDNPSLFDYDADGVPRSFVATLRHNGLGCRLPADPPGTGPRLPEGDYVYHHVPGMDWQLDPNGVVINAQIVPGAMNYVAGSDQVFLTANLDTEAATVSVVDLRAGTLNAVLKCPAAAVMFGEPSGSPGAFVMLGAPYPYQGATFGLNDGTFVHDVYLVTPYEVGPWTAPDGSTVLVAPSVVAAYRRILGRDPDMEGALLWTDAVRAGATDAQLAMQIAASDEAAAQIARVYQRILGRAPTTDEIASARAMLAAGGDLRTIAEGLAAQVCAP